MSALTRWANSIAVSFSWKGTRQAGVTWSTHCTTTYFSTFSRGVNSHYTIAKVSITWQHCTSHLADSTSMYRLPVCAWAPGSKCHIWPPNSSLTSLGRWASSGARSSSRDQRGYDHTRGMVVMSTCTCVLLHVCMCVWPGIVEYVGFITPVTKCIP